MHFRFYKTLCIHFKLDITNLFFLNLFSIYLYTHDSLYCPVRCTRVSVCVFSSEVKKLKLRMESVFIFEVTFKKKFWIIAYV